MNDPYNQYNDCVIAARAHHTIRFDYIAGAPALNISNDEVVNEYFHENGGSISSGIVPQTSLGLWRDVGWTAGGIRNRQITDFSDPLIVKGAALVSDDPSNEINETDMMSYIYGYTGIQVDLLLPDGIDVRSPGTYGPTVLWNDTRHVQVSPHLMLLTGYDDKGPIGITWGVKQAMTWDFLRWCCRGVFVVYKGANT
jgi:hypothetical protein